MKGYLATFIKWPILQKNHNKNTSRYVNKNYCCFSARAYFKSSTFTFTANVLTLNVISKYNLTQIYTYIYVTYTGPQL